MARALYITAQRKTFYAAPTGLYRYWFAPAHALQHAVLKIQMSRATMAKFMSSPEGRAQIRFADVFEIGGGWYEITSKDLSDWNEWFGGKADGAKMWLKAFNLSHLQIVDANPHKFNIERVRRVEPNVVLTKPPVWMPSPEKTRDQERLDSKLRRLQQQFARR
jgi:hypothetical protein